MKSNLCSDKKRGLIIQPGAIGDGILTLPLVRLLSMQERMGHLIFDIMGHKENLGFLQSRAGIGEVISIESANLHHFFKDSETFEPPEGDPLIGSFGQYDLIVSFLADSAGHFERNLARTVTRSRSADIVTIALKPPADYDGHVSWFFMEQFLNELPHSQVTIIPEVMNEQLIRHRPEDLVKGWEILEAKGIKGAKPIVALHPGSGGAGKCWPLKNYQDLAGRLKEQGYQPIMLLGPVEMERWEQEAIKEIGTQTPLLTGLTIDEVTAVLSCCKGYVGNDSGITHLAGGLGLATVAIFGPSNPTQWRPLGRNVRVCVWSDGPDNVWPRVEEVAGQVMEIV